MSGAPEGERADAAGASAPPARPGAKGWRGFVDAALLEREDASALGMCRAALVFVFTLSMLSHVGAVSEWFSDDAPIFGDYARRAFHSRWSLFFYVREAWAVQLVFAAGLLAHILWLLGLYTRVSSFVAWVVWISMVGRNPLLYAMPDQWHSAIALYLMILPSGRGFSLDARWRRKGQTVPVWCRRLLHLQVAALYVGSALAKSGATWRESGEAIYYAAASPYNRHFEIGEILARAQPYVLRPLTFVVRWWELLFGVFVVLHWIAEASGRALRVPLRALFLGFGVAMHLGIQLLLYVGWFSPLTLAAYVSFLRPAEASRVIAWAQRIGARARRS